MSAGSMGTQRSRRADRAISRYYRKRDPWDAHPRDRELGVQSFDRGPYRAAERHFVQKEAEDATS